MNRFANFAAVISGITLASVAVAPARAQPAGQLLFNFGAVYTPAAGFEPLGGLTQGAGGALFGTTLQGGTGIIYPGATGGIVYQLTPPVAGSRWTEQVLHDFPAFPGDGFGPRGNLLAGPGGVLYGVTPSGGTDKFGMVYMLVPPVDGGVWTETILHNFDNSDGASPFAGLVSDANGALYGTTLLGGSADYGTVYKLTPPAQGQTSWTEAVLYSFPANGSGGRYPVSQLVFGAGGTLYGTTQQGGELPFCSCGTVFSLSHRSGGGAWVETVLKSFGEAGTGQDPQAGVAMDKAGNLYGVNAIGGHVRADCGPYCGVVFELLAPRAGRTDWLFTALHRFTDRPDGAVPIGGLAIDAQGNLFGTTEGGGGGGRGCPYGCGTAFKLARPVGGVGPWAETVFAIPSAAVGERPQADLLIGTDQILYGTMSQGGRGGGAVFSLTP